MEPIIKECKLCGENKSHSQYPSGTRYCCMDCFNAQCRAERARLKHMAVEYKGGCCERCGLRDECLAIYDFHHVDPNEKDFCIGNATTYVSERVWQRVKAELDKCMLLCSNCHQREHARAA